MKNKKQNTGSNMLIHIVLIMASAVIIAVCGYNAYKFSNSIFDEKSVDTWNNARQINVVIPEEVTPKQLAKIMYDNGLTNDEQLFYYQILLSDFRDKIVPGTYKLQTSMKPTEILKNISAEDTSAE